MDLGEDIYITNSQYTFTLDKVSFYSPQSKNSIYIEQAALFANEIIIKDYYNI